MNDTPKFVVVQTVWAQCSANYDAVKSTRTLVVSPNTTVEQIMKWARSANALGSGDIVITQEDAR